MTPDQITQLRQLLKKAKNVLDFSIANFSNGQVLCLEKLKQALALLPCSTCNGTGQCMGPKMGKLHMIALMDCPDCK